MPETEQARRKPLFTPFHGDGEENLVALAARSTSCGDVANRINELSCSSNPDEANLGRQIAEDLQKDRWSAYLPSGCLPLIEQMRDYLAREYHLNPTITLSQPVGDNLFL